MGQVLAVSVGDDAVVAADAVKGSRGLIDKFLPMDKHADTIAFDSCLLGNVREDYSFSPTCWEDKENAS